MLPETGFRIAAAPEIVVLIECAKALDKTSVQPVLIEPFGMTAGRMRVEESLQVENLIGIKGQFAGI